MYAKINKLKIHIFCITFQEDVGVYCVPAEFVALNFPPVRVQQNSMFLHPTPSVIDSSSITLPHQQNQQQIAVQRIGRDARPLLAAEVARYQQVMASGLMNRMNRLERLLAELPSRQRRAEAALHAVPSQERLERPENLRLRNLAQRIPRLSPVPNILQSVPERARSQPDRSLAMDEFVLRLPFVDLGPIQPTTHLMSPSGRRFNLFPTQANSAPENPETGN